MSLQAIGQDCGLTITGYESVHGGDINLSYRLQTNEGEFFLKLNDASRYPSMFETEAAGLLSLRNNSSLIIPLVIRQGIVSQQQYLLLQWIERGTPRPDCQEKFGAGLADLHRKPQAWFGWEKDNYIGSLPQRNTKHDSWSSFYQECRILPLVHLLFNTGSFSNHDVKSAERFCERLQQIFPPEPPSLLHGDLWSGNYMISASGYASVFDPAVYCGHREMDIGMTKLFGGFHDKFYEAYHEIYPLEKNWKQRLAFSQLYPLLVHAVLFGGHYISSTRKIMNQF
jgi:fructosamine-3-kinase